MSEAAPDRYELSIIEKLPDKIPDGRAQTPGFPTNATLAGRTPSGTPASASSRYFRQDSGNLLPAALSAFWRVLRVRLAAWHNKLRWAVRRPCS